MGEVLSWPVWALTADDLGDISITQGKQREYPVLAGWRESGELEPG